MVQTNGTPHPDAIELVWGHDPGGMAQFVTWTGNSSYNPTQAGDMGSNTNDWGRGSPIYSAACKDNTHMIIQSTTAEYFMNDASWGNNMNYGRAAMITQGSPRNDMWFTPYAITLTATFVPNPSGSPAYYLKLDHYVHATDIREPFTNHYATFGLYVPTSLSDAVYSPNCNPTGCTGATKLLAGHYTDTTRTTGIAAALNVSTQASGLTVNQKGPFHDTNWNNRSSELNVSDWILQPGTGRRFVVYLLAGSWSAAQAFNPE